ncbi:MAG: hypothetical protein WCI55_16300 [Armatimonadota bacterium]
MKSGEYRIFGVLMLFSTVLLSILTGQEVRSQERFVELDLAVTESNDGNVIEKIDLGQAGPGDVLNVKLNIENALQDSFEFKKVSVGCSCTTAIVPSVSLPARSKETCEFRIVIGKNERKPRKQIDIVIMTEGAVQRIILQLTVAVKDVVSFATESVVLDTQTPSSSNDGFVQKAIPITISDSLKAEQLVIQVDNELQGVVAAAIASENGSYLLKLRIDSSRPIQGRVQVGKDSESFRPVEIVVRDRPEIEILTPVVVFNSVSDLNISGSIVIRTRGTFLTDDLDFDCKTRSGIKFKTEQRRIGSGLYRLEFLVEKQSLEEFRNLTEKIDLTIMAGDSTRTETIRGRFVW